MSSEKLDSERIFLISLPIFDVFMLHKPEILKEQTEKKSAKKVKLSSHMSLLSVAPQISKDLTCSIINVEPQT